MSNSLLTISMITNEALAVLENQLTFTKTVNKEYSKEFGRSGAKIGSTVNVRKPVRYVTRRTPTLAVQNTTETYVPVVLNNQYGCDVSFTSAELALSIDLFSDRILKPMVAQVANSIDYDGLLQTLNIYQNVGVAGTTPNALLTYLQAGVALDNSAAPMGDRSMIVNPIAQATIVDGLKGLFNPQANLSQQYIKGQMGTAAGYDWYMDQNISAQVVGTYGGTPVVNGAGQTGSSLVTNGWTATTTTLNVGDTFTLAGVFSVNPQNYTSTGSLQQFVVTTKTVTDGSGNSTIAISPSITPIDNLGPGGINGNPYATVTASPATGAAIVVSGASGVSKVSNILHCRDAFTFANADLELPGGVDMAKRVSSDKVGLSMRVVRAYDINNDRFPMRIDLLGGWATLRPELGCRVYG